MAAKAWPARAGDDAGYANCRRCGRVLNFPYRKFYVVIRPVMQDEESKTNEPVVSMSVCQACMDEIKEVIERR